MPLTEEQHAQIRTDLIEAFQTKYGDQWHLKLTKNLRPSPIPTIAQQRGVPVSQVRKVRSQLLMLGMVYQALQGAMQAEPQSQTLQ
jgi:hypothetical protein